MGSLSPSLPPRSLHSLNTYRIYASFCSRDLPPNTSISNWIECYNPSNNSWNRVTEIPGLPDNHVLKGFSIATVEDSIYVIGGKLRQKVPGNDPDDNVAEVDVEVLRSVLRYDINNDRWIKCAPLRVPRFNFACVVCNNRVFVAGGQSTLGSARGISSAEVFDPAVNEWQALPDMSTLRYKCVGVTWQGKIHVVGGFAEKRDSGMSRWHTMERSSAEVYDWENEKWDLMVGMWQLDVPPNQIVDIDGKLFSSGDCLNAWKGHIEAYDAKLNIWNVVDGSPLQTFSSPISTSETRWPPIQRLYLTMAPIGTQLYFLAGYKKPGEISRLTSIVHVFNTSANGDGWTSLEPMEEEGEKELCSHCCVVRQH